MRPQLLLPCWVAWIATSGCEKQDAPGVFHILSRNGGVGLEKLDDPQSSSNSRLNDCNIPFFILGIDINCWLVF